MVNYGILVSEKSSFRPSYESLAGFQEKLLSEKDGTGHNIISEHHIVAIKQVSIHSLLHFLPASIHVHLNKVSPKNRMIVLFKLGNHATVC